MKDEEVRDRNKTVRNLYYFGMTPKLVPIWRGWRYDNGKPSQSDPLGGTKSITVALCKVAVTFSWHKCGANNWYYGKL